MSLKKVCVQHFDTYENLMIWENSEERIEQVEFSKPFFEEIKPKLQARHMVRHSELTAQKLTYQSLPSLTQGNIF